MKFIQKVNMASETVNSYMRSGILTAEDAPVTINSGDFLIVKGLLNNEVLEYFGQETKDFNKFEMRLPVTADVTAENITVYVADPVNVSSGEIMGVTYREGVKTLGVTVPADEPSSLRKLVADDMFYLGEDNFVSTPTVGKFAVLTNNDARLTPAAADSASGLCIAIEDSKPFVEGIDVTATGYLCRVVHF